jgi:protein-tyrosine phosphatase
VIDLHCHVLPELDGGPRDEQEAGQLLADLAADGVDLVAATPRYEPGVNVSDVGRRFTRTRARLQRASGVQLVQAGQAAPEWAQRASAEQLRAASYGGLGKDILLDCAAGESAALIATVAAYLRGQGYRVLLAHPERNVQFQLDPRRLGELLAAGALAQLNCESVLSSDRGSRERRLAHILLKEGQAHVIATDARARDGARLGEAARIAESLGGRRARWMVTAAPAAIVAGAPLPPAPGERR